MPVTFSMLNTSPNNLHASDTVSMPSRAENDSKRGIRLSPLLQNSHLMGILPSNRHMTVIGEGKRDGEGEHKVRPYDSRQASISNAGSTYGDRGSRLQSSTLIPGMDSKCLVLQVTSVKPFVIAIAAMRQSRVPGRLWAADQLRNNVSASSV